MGFYCVSNVTAMVNISNSYRVLSSKSMGHDVVTLGGHSNSFLVVKWQSWSQLKLYFLLQHLSKNIKTNGRGVFRV